MRYALTNKDAVILIFTLTLRLYMSKAEDTKIIKREVSNAEKEVLRRFRPLVKDVLYKDYMNEDYYLIPFLRAKDMDVGKSAEMLRQAHKWRRENGIDEILKENNVKLLKPFPYYSDAIDYEGRPVISWDFGRWDIRRMTLGGGMPELVRYLDRILEDAVTRVRQQRKITGKDVTQYIMIIDGHGFNLRSHACFTCLPFYYTFITHSDQYYPRSGNAVYLLNMPRVFDSVLSLIRPVMSPYIRDNLKMYGFESAVWKAEFSKKMPLNLLRKQFGGTKENSAPNLPQY